jgi:hypothetical protein
MAERRQRNRPTTTAGAAALAGSVAVSAVEDGIEPINVPVDAVGSMSDVFINKNAFVARCAVAGASCGVCVGEYTCDPTVLDQLDLSPQLAAMCPVTGHLILDSHQNDLIAERDRMVPCKTCKKLWYPGNDPFRRMSPGVVRWFKRMAKINFDQLAGTVNGTAMGAAALLTIGMPGGFDPRNQKTIMSSVHDKLLQSTDLYKNVFVCPLCCTSTLSDVEQAALLSPLAFQNIPQKVYPVPPGMNIDPNSDTYETFVDEATNATFIREYYQPIQVPPENLRTVVFSAGRFVITQDNVPQTLQTTTGLVYRGRWYTNDPGDHIGQPALIRFTETSLDGTGRITNPVFMGADHLHEATIMQLAGLALSFGGSAAVTPAEMARIALPELYAFDLVVSGYVGAHTAGTTTSYPRYAFVTSDYGFENIKNITKHIGATPDHPRRGMFPIGSQDEYNCLLMLQAATTAVARAHLHLLSRGIALQSVWLNRITCQPLVDLTVPTFTVTNLANVIYCYPPEFDDAPSRREWFRRQNQQGSAGFLDLKQSDGETTNLLLRTFNYVPYGMDNDRVIRANYYGLDAKIFTERQKMFKGVLNAFNGLYSVFISNKTKLQSTLSARNSPYVGKLFTPVYKMVLRFAKEAQVTSLGGIQLINGVQVVSKRAKKQTTVISPLKVYNTANIISVV